MEWNLIFLLNSVLLGLGLAMDAFSVSIANALNESKMKKGRMCFIAGVYAFFSVCYANDWLDLCSYDSGIF